MEERRTTDGAFHQIQGRTPFPSSLILSVYLSAHSFILSHRETTGSYRTHTVRTSISVNTRRRKWEAGYYSLLPFRGEGRGMKKETGLRKIPHHICIAHVNEKTHIFVYTLTSMGRMDTVHTHANTGQETKDSGLQRAKREKERDLFKRSTGGHIRRDETYSRGSFQQEIHHYKGNSRFGK